MTFDIINVVPSSPLSLPHIILTFPLILFSPNSGRRDHRCDYWGGFRFADPGGGHLLSDALPGGPARLQLECEVSLGVHAASSMS